MGYSGSSQAEAARQKLGTALEALQHGDDVPAQALALTEHIAQAVSALFEAERASTEPDGKACVKSALSTLSQTMALLQDVKGTHAGVEGATERLAEVLSSLFPLVNKTTRPPRPAADASPPSPPAPPRPAFAPAQPLGAAAKESHKAATAPPKQSAASPGDTTTVQPPSAQTGSFGEPGGPSPLETPAAPTAPPRSPVAVSGQPTSPQPPEAPISVSIKPVGGPLSEHGAAIPNSLLPPEAPTPSGPRERIEANIGATTESNFYVGLSGEIAHGGVFLATYESLKKDKSVRMLVTLPGGFEFECDGYVRFVRDPMDFSSESGPGMGIQFEKLGEEARELVLRFIRKRPPIFYDV